MTCNTKENAYVVNFPGPAGAGVPVWLDQQGFQAGVKTMLIWNEGPNKIRFKNQSDFKFAVGIPVWAGQGIVLRNVSTAIKHYVLCNGADTSEIHVLELAP